MASPFQALFDQYVTQTGDGSYFVPFSATQYGQDINDPGSWFTQSFNSDNDPSRQDFSSLNDYYNALDPTSVAITGGSRLGGSQNALGFDLNGLDADTIKGVAPKRATGPNGELGYSFGQDAANRIVGTNPATTGGGKPNDIGLWQALAIIAPAFGAVTGLFGGAAAGGTAEYSDAATGTGAFGGNIPTAGGELSTAASAAAQQAAKAYLGTQGSSGAATKGTNMQDSGGATNAGAAADAAGPGYTYDAFGNIIPNDQAASVQASQMTAANAPDNSGGGDASSMTIPQSVQDALVKAGGQVLLSSVLASLQKGPKASTANQASLDAINQQNNLAQQQWAMFTQREAAANADAQNIDSPANITRVQGEAHADASQASTVAAQNAKDALRAYGVEFDPNRMAALQSGLAVQGAATDAGAQSAATNALRQQGVQARQNEAVLTSKLPTTAGTMLGNAAATGATLGNNAFNQGAVQNRAIGQLAQPLVGAVTDWIKSPSSTSAGSNIQTVGSGASNDFGSTPDYSSGDVIYGGYADGGVKRPVSGLVRGPGTGTSDSIPAIGVKGEPIRIANGEYIVPADVVRHLGVKYFDNLKNKYHQPVAGRA